MNIFQTPALSQPLMLKNEEGPIQSENHTSNMLRRDFLQLKSIILTSQPPYYTPHPAPITYDRALQAGRLLKTETFNLRNTFKDYFIHAVKSDASCDHYYDGDKLHISVSQEQLNTAFNSLAPLLFSIDSPFSHWKVTDELRYPTNERLAMGGQLTLYAAADRTDSTYSAEYLIRVRQFLLEIESILKQANIQVGRRPHSDVFHPNWNYCSYRNEFRSEREGSHEQSIALQEEAFFKLLSLNSLL